MNKILILIFFTLCGNISASFAQLKITYGRFDSIQVQKNTSTAYYNHPWAGGLSAPQFSNIDINGDGKQDLFVFDRNGNSIKIFIKEGGANSTAYSYAPEYRQYFPYLEKFALLRDMNCDGKPDIVSFKSPGMSMWINTNDTVLGFRLKDDFKDSFAGKVNYVTSQQNQFIHNMYINETDIPVIDDIDGDGDMDIIVFGIFGTTAEYHKNMVKENDMHCDSIEFKLITNCWGLFVEDAQSNSVSLNQPCWSFKDTMPDPGIGVRHAGTAMLTLDFDNDGDKDLLLGDIGYSNVTALINGGTKDSASMIAQDPAFPSYNVPVDIFIFPASFYVDVDNDGKNDLMVAPNEVYGVQNTDHVWFYKNLGTNTNPNFNLQKRNFLVDEMIDVGDLASPVFVDVNGDSLLDIIIGNYGYYQGVGNYVGSLSYYQNIGSDTIPVFKLITTDFQNLSNLGLNAIHPTFGDLDGDGDLDMLIGDLNGELHYFTNTAGQGNSMTFTLTQAQYFGIDVGQFATPYLFDLNKDGKLDLIIGERNGNLNYIENTGSATNATFSTTNMVENFGGVSFVNMFNVGYTAPFLVDLDTAGVATDTNSQTYLFVANEEGWVHVYTDIAANINGTFTKVDSMYVTAARGRIGGGDVTGNGKVELVIGEIAGGVHILTKDGNFRFSPPPPPDTTTVVEKIEYKAPVNIFPNPTSEILNIDFGDAFNDGLVSIKIYDVLGKLMYANTSANANSQIIGITITDLPNGIYVISLAQDEKSYTKKFLKN